MVDFSLILHFKNSRSKNFAAAVKLAGNFEKCQLGDYNSVTVQLKEIFEKWDYFNLLFWAVVDWRGTMVELDGMKWTSHTDMTRFFYAIQDARIQYVNYQVYKYYHLYKVYLQDITYEELEKTIYTESEMNWLIEKFNMKRINEELASEQSFKEINVRERSECLQRVKLLLD
jgi:hypothetical protein